MEFGHVGFSVERLQRQLLGTEDCSIDEKGRIRLSKKKQTSLGENFVLTLKESGILAAYPLDVWNEKVTEVYEIPHSSEEREKRSRELGSFAEGENSCDPQGRFVVPFRLRKVSGLERAMEITLVGCLDHIEIWVREDFEKNGDRRAKTAQKRRKALEEDS